MQFKYARWILFLCGSWLIGNVVSCDRAKPQQDQHEMLVFNVDQTLLESAVTDADLNISISAPKNWITVDDSVLTQVTTRLADQQVEGFQINPRWIFLNHQSQAMCVVSRLDSVDITKVESLLGDVKTAYHEKFSTAQIKSATFLKDEFRVHQLMVSTSEFVFIKLWFDGLEVPMFEVDYVVPKNAYGSELRAIESSIGSIRLIKNQP